MEVMQEKEGKREVEALLVVALRGREFHEQGDQKNGQKHAVKLLRLLFDKLPIVLGGKQKKNQNPTNVSPKALQQ